MFCRKYWVSAPRHSRARCVWVYLFHLKTAGSFNRSKRCVVFLHKERLEKSKKSSTFWHKYSIAIFKLTVQFIYPLQQSVPLAQSVEILRTSPFLSYLANLLQRDRTGHSLTTCFIVLSITSSITWLVGCQFPFTLPVVIVSALARTKAIQRCPFLENKSHPCQSQWGGSKVWMICS